MIDKLQYYHGAAIIALLESGDLSVKKRGALGYIVNDKIFVFLKYRTTPRTPWVFSFDQEDVNRCTKMASEYNAVIVGLICGGDGICWLTWNEASTLIDSKPGWIASRRKHNGSYGLTGQVTDLKRKIPVSRWSTITSEVI